MIKVIYGPRGKAAEYCPLAANLYKGCNHGCTYCYCPDILRQSQNDFNIPKERPGVLESLQKYAREYTGKEVLFCFTTDPYNSLDAQLQITRKAIQILHANGVIVRILTKAGTKSQRDFDLLAAKPELSRYGATLTFALLADSRKYEPGAAWPMDRLAALEDAHSRGIPTWVSIEPVIDPRQSLELIELARFAVDEFKIGKLNHQKNDIDWRQFGMDAIALLKKFDKRYYIKNDLLAYLPGESQKG
jgi:DNA repair photolyase